MPNGLMDPMQLGQSIQNAFLMGAQQRAFSNYAQNPSRESAQGVAGLNPDLGMRLMDREDQRASQQQEMAWKRVETIAKLARGVRDEPTYQRALQIASNLGIDTTGAPPNYDPNWVAQRAQEYEFFAGPQGRDAVSAAGKQAMDMGFTPGTPEYQTAVTQLIEAGLAQPYTGDQGETRLYTPRIGIQPPQAAQPPQMAQGGLPITFEALQQYLAQTGQGPEALPDFIRRNSYAVQVQSPDQARMLPSGTPIILPDGTLGRVP